MEITRHFTATTYIVCQNKVLLHLHKKLNLWLAVGGHIDRDELPEEAAKREIKEESGLEVNLYRYDKDLNLKKTKQLNKPIHLLLEDINAYHQHIDFIYYAKSDTLELNPENGETRNLKWFSKEDLTKIEMPDNVKACALEALEILSKV